MTVDTLWEQALGTLSTKINRPLYEMFIRRITPVSLSDTTLLLKIPASSLMMGYYNDYRLQIMDAVCEAGGKPLSVEAMQDDAAPLPLVAKPEITVQPSPVVAPSAASLPRPQRISPFLNPRYTFESFVVGASNRLCHAASLAVAEAPGRAYNPLFIYGGVGLGKTHLMQAIGHYVLAAKPNLNVLYITTDAFVNDVITSIQENRLYEYSNQMKKTDVLLVDDIQYLEKKERTQHEFFNIFNSLFQAQKQIVLTCDRPPKDLSTLEERLRTRFGWGLIADLQTPDFETRIAILKKKLEDDEVKMPAGALDMIASAVVSNIRDLEGALIRIIAYANLCGQEITLELVENVIREIAPMKQQGPISANQIIDAVCKYFSIDAGDLIGKRRKQEIAKPRHMAMYLCRDLTDMSLQSIGKIFDKDHSSVLYACEKIERETNLDPNLKQTVEAIKGRLSVS